MKILKLLTLAMMLNVSLYGADNEIYIDQSGDTANIDLEQLGSGNIMGGLNSVAGTLTALDLDGLNITYNIYRFEIDALNVVLKKAAVPMGDKPANS